MRMEHTESRDERARERWVGLGRGLARERKGLAETRERVLPFGSDAKEIFAFFTFRERPALTSAIESTYAICRHVF